MPVSFPRLLRRYAALVMTAVIAVTGSETIVPTTASAQQAQRPWGLFDLFAPPRPSRRVERSPGGGVERAPAARGETIQRRKNPPSEAVPTKKRQKAVVKATRAPVEVAVVPVEKAADARTILVVGDFLAGGLSEGLEAAFGETKGVRIVDRTKGSSGFVRRDFHDWPATVAELVETEKPVAVVLMLGANDRQQMRVDGKAEVLRSEAWNREYVARTKELAKAIGDRKVPFLWVGMPSFRSPKMLSDMLAFNDIYRAAAESAGGEFIDVWDGFVDESGAFVTTGPDVTGQPTKLRAGDGINLTKSGRRKLAFYLEKPLAKLLGGAPADSPAVVMPASLSPVTEPMAGAANIDRTVPIALSDPVLDGGAELLGLPGSASRTAQTPAEKLIRDGIAPDSVPGRADDFSSSTEPGKAPTAETTTAITR